MSADPFFPGFLVRRREIDGVLIHARIGGEGPPLVLIHGAPQSGVLWREVAPRLAQNFTVVVPDLRGYGRSGKPAEGSYTKRRMARDILELMRHEGFERFDVAGHDRGARVARRLAKDHPAAVDRLALLDIAPTAHIYGHVDRRVAAHMWHWFFLIQPAPVPETLMGPQAEAFVRGLFGHRAAPSAALEDYAATNGAPDAFHAMCEDYRAGAGEDLEHDRCDADHPIEAATLILWGEASFSTGALFDMREIWRLEARRLSFASLPCGHFLPEELPDETTSALLEHFSRAGAAGPRSPGA